MVLKKQMTLKEILRQIGERHGVDQLNPMQRAVGAAKSERLILLAPTGSGKTLAFAVPLMSRLRPDGIEIPKLKVVAKRNDDGTERLKTEQPLPSPQALVIAPARELVLQIADVIRPIAKGYKTVALYGGHSMEDETNSLSIVPDIVVATPGRLLDHMLRGSIDTARTPALVLDEYDKALELGFVDQMRRIVKRMRRLRYVTLTSATPLLDMPDFIDLSQAKVIDYTNQDQNPRSRTRIELVRSEDKDKLQALGRLLRSLPNGRTIVFVNHRESAERVFNYLSREKFPVGLYHGGLDQLQREMAVDMINNGTTPVLASTDLGSRGLDIEAVRQVVHYHLPPTPESWTHRNGRTARVDAEGNVYVLLSPGEATPEYVDADGEYVPDDNNPDPIRSDVATIYFNLGKKEKVSKGDVMGFLGKQCGLNGKEIGRIVVKDHCAIAAVPRCKAEATLQAASGTKIKGQRVKVSLFE